MYLSILLLLPSQRHLWLRHAWRHPKQRPNERLYPYELQHSRPHLMAPTTAHRKAWVLCTTATHLDFKAPRAVVWRRSSCTLLQAFSERQDKLKSRWHTYTNPPPGQFVLLDLLAHRSAKMLVRLPSTCRGKTAVQFPANSSHTCCVELTLKGVLYTCLGRKRPLNTWALIRVNSFSWLPRPWWYGCAHALGTGRASFQFFFQFP